MRVIVVGGGIVGASAAFRLAEAGAEVALLEAGRLGGGTSAATFAWLNSNDKSPFEYHELNVAGMTEHSHLRQEFETAAWLHLDGNIEWAPDGSMAAALRAKVERLRGWGYPVEWLPVSELRNLEPELRAPTDVAQFAFYPAEGYVDVPVLVGALARAAEEAGATVRNGCRVTAPTLDRSRVRGVVTAEGEHLDADLVVSCVGRWTDQFVALAGVRLPLAPTSGLLAISHPSAVGVHAILHTHEVNLRADGGGRIMMRAGEFDRTVGPETPVVPLPEVCAQILERATRVLPRLAGTGLEAARVGVRPIPADGYPAVGPVPGVEGLYVVCTHSGVTLGPVLGRFIAQEVVKCEVDKRLRPFRAARLAKAAGAEWR
jgi:glycine/D-amino acid oxidase-like deaminating enzyme